MKKVFLVLIALIGIGISAYAQKTKTILVTPSTARIYVNGSEVATGTYVLKMKDEIAILKFRAPGYYTKEVKLLKSDPRKAISYTLDIDEAEANSIGVEAALSANKWVTITVKQKIIIFATFCFYMSSICAQERIETFHSNLFGWEEYHNKKLGNVIIQDGFLKLNAKKSILSPKVNFPIDLQRNFKITYKFLVPILDKNSFFGITFSATDENQGVFMVSENQYTATYKGMDRRGKIPLKKGKDQIVVLEMEKRGRTLIFSVNNMVACEISEELQTSKFGILLYAPAGKATVLVDEIIIKQAEERED
jgi:hypothetical protein